MAKRSVGNGLADSNDKKPILAVDNYRMTGRYYGGVGAPFVFRQTVRT